MVHNTKVQTKTEIFFIYLLLREYLPKSISLTKTTTPL